MRSENNKIVEKGIKKKNEKGNVGEKKDSLLSLTIFNRFLSNRCLFDSFF